MINRIKAILNKLDNINDWKIIESISEDNEFFFVGRNLDMNRAKKVKQYLVTVYRDFEEEGEKYRGSATAKIHPTMLDEEIRVVLEESVFAAGFVKNKPYPLAEASLATGNVESEMLKGEISDWISKVTGEIFATDGDCLNSVEIFVNRGKKRILNSKEVDAAFEYANAFIEIITSATGKDEEVELYHQLRLSGFEPGEITEQVSEKLRLTKDRAAAVFTPPLKKATVLLTGEPAAQLLGYYLDRASVKMVYEKLSTAKIGESVQGEEVKGDKITLLMDPFVPGSYYSAPYDGDGLALKKETIIEDGILKKYWGDVRYSYYMGVEPTGSATNYVINPGEKTQEELRSDPYLEVASFSAFNVDEITGDFGGEIRLGWYFDGEKRLPVCGGSVTGNIKDVQEELYLSKEIHNYHSFVGPKTVKLNNVTVAGIE